MLNLDDFGKLKDINILKSRKNQEEITPKEVEEFYQEKILELEENYRKKLEETKKEYFEKGFKEAVKKKDEEFQNILKDLKEKVEKEKEQEINNISQKYRYIEKDLKEKIDQYLTDLSNILLDNLEEILEFLYIQNSNKDIIKDAITQTILEFKESIPIEIKVSPTIYDEINKSFTNIKIEKDDNLKNGDYVIEFYDFKLENRFKEKIEVLKDEIKRETKKFT